MPISQLKVLLVSFSIAKAEQLRTDLAGIDGLKLDL
jgi:hypothetical protein